MQEIRGRQVTRRHSYEDVRQTTDLFARIQMLDDDMAAEQLYHDGVTPHTLAEKFNMSAGAVIDGTFFASMHPRDVVKLMEERHMSRAVIQAVTREMGDCDDAFAGTGNSARNTDRFVRENIGWINRTVQKKIAACGTILEAVRAVKNISNIIAGRYVDREIVPWLMQKNGRLYMIKTVCLNSRGDRQ